MDWKTFFIIILGTVAFTFCFVGYVSTKYDTKRLEQENEKLKAKKGGKK